MRYDVSVLMTTQTSAAKSSFGDDAVFRTIFEQSTLGMGRVGFGDARWLDVNPAFCRMLGRSRDEMLSTPWPQMTHPDDVHRDLL